MRQKQIAVLTEPIDGGPVHLALEARVVSENLDVLRYALDTRLI
jgi:TPP-dependent trihydroxycyclohexane-1,2-dione (THcHDO) dehydratase